MLRELGVIFPAQRSVDDEQSTTASGADTGKNSVNFAKYEGKIESVGEGT